MKNSTLLRLLIVQSALLVGLGWAVVYLGRDEYRLVVGRADDDLPARSQLVEDDDTALPVVRLSGAAQQRVGIEVAAPRSAAAAAATPATTSVTVVDAQPLVDWRSRLLVAQQAAEQAAAAARVSDRDRRRVQALFDDDRNASQRDLENANALATAELARRDAAVAQAALLRRSARAAWGPTIGGWLADDGGATAARDPLEALISGRDKLLLLVLRADDDAQPPAQLQLPAAPGRPATVARLLDLVPSTSLGAVDAAPGGRHLLYRAAGAGLAAGMRLAVRSAGEAAGQPGVLVPGSALIWHAGQPWVYLRESEAAADTGRASANADDDDSKAAASAQPAAGFDRFQRRGVPAAQRRGDQWLVHGLSERDRVVVQGAQVLLSEELKFQIKNENDD